MGLHVTEVYPPRAFQIPADMAGFVKNSFSFETEGTLLMVERVVTILLKCIDQCYMSHHSSLPAARLIKKFPLLFQNVFFNVNDCHNGKPLLAEKLIFRKMHLSRFTFSQEIFWIAMQCYFFELYAFSAECTFFKSI